MGPRATAAAGIFAGAGAALAILVAAVLLLPDPKPSIGATATPSPSVTGEVSPGAAGSSAPAPSVQATIGTTGFRIGEKAPALSVAQLGGGQIDLTALIGRPVWVNFMQTTCPPCVDEFPLMNGFAVRYADTGLVVVAVDIREDEGTVGTFVRSLNAQFPVGLDTDGAAAQAWGAVALPIHFWVDREGIIRAGALGGIGPDVMAESLATILPGVEVTP